MTPEKKSVNREVTKLKKIIQRQETEIFQLKNIIDNLPGDIYWKNKQGVYTGINIRGGGSLRKMGFAWKPDEIIGKTDYDLYKKETADQFRANDLMVMETGQESTTQESAMLPSGEKIVQLSTKRPLRDQRGHVTGIVGNTIDITYLKKIESDLRSAKEAAENANKAKTEFLYNMRHDIRTPFNGLLSLSMLLEQQETNLQKKEYLHDIAQSAQELLNYLNEIVEYTGLEDSSIPILYKPFNIRQLIDEIITIMLPAVKYKFVRIQSKIDKAIPKTLIGDHYRVHRILLNLVGNAVKFTQEGTVTIGVDLVKKENREMRLKIWVKDTGIGIPEDKYNVIFERFNRLTASYSGLYKGTGLGLWAVKRLMEELGGQVFVESKPGAGSLFSCIIPFECLLAE